MNEIEEMPEVEAGQLAPDEEQEQAMQAQRRKDMLDSLGYSLQKKVTDCVTKKSDIEARWLEDIRQYNGLYDDKTESALKKSGGSSLFVNITRPKCTTAEARLADMLFPTDEKNWGISPTPVPELSAIAKQIKEMEPTATVETTPEGAPVTAQDIQTGMKSVMDEAEEKAAAMEAQINDQLEEGGYTIKCRDAIHDAVILGTGILKGPCIIGRVKRTWQEVDGQYVIGIVEDKTPTPERVDPWDFFPDMSATRIEDCEYILQRHYMTKKQMRELKRSPGFSEYCIDELLMESPTQPVASYRAELRSISGISGIEDNRYEVWEYHGPLSRDELAAAGVDIEDETVSEMEAVVFFCQGKVIKAILNPMDTSDRPYSVYNWEKDDSSIFGFGVPYLLRVPQKTVNASWRMVMDNAGLSTGPQIVVKAKAVRPINGKWKLEPRKVWEMTDMNGSVNDVFGAFEINSHQAELSAIYSAGMEMADQLINLPQIAQGDQAPHLTQTAKGMSILMNAANTTMRRAVKNWDDDVTKQMITRFYDWNMQFSSKKEIKGDLYVVARGTSALLEREAQTDRLLALINLAPGLGGLIKIPKAARKLVQSMNLPAEELVMSEDEIKQMQSQPPQPNPDMLKLEIDKAKVDMQAQNNQMDFETERNRQNLAAQKMVQEGQQENQRIQLELERMSTERGMSVEALRTELGLKQMDIQSDERKLAAELDIKSRMGSGI